MKTVVLVLVQDLVTVVVVAVVGVRELCRRNEKKITHVWN